MKLPAEFVPRQVPLGTHRPGSSVFSVPLDVLPEGTKRIQISAYDDFASTPLSPPSERREH